MTTTFTAPTPTDLTTAARALWARDTAHAVSRVLNSGLTSSDGEFAPLGLIGGDYYVEQAVESWIEAHNTLEPDNGELRRDQVLKEVYVSGHYDLEVNQLPLTPSSPRGAGEHMVSYCRRIWRDALPGAVAELDHFLLAAMAEDCEVLEHLALLPASSRWHTTRAPDGLDDLVVAVLPLGHPGAQPNHPERPAEVRLARVPACLAPWLIVGFDIHVVEAAGVSDSKVSETMSVMLKDGASPKDALDRAVALERD